MENIYLTATGMNVSRICLGTMTFGAQTKEGDAIAIVKRAVERGINFIDTANIYTGGESERITGKAIKGMRDKLILASKVSGPTEKGPNGQGLSRRHILSALDKSLQRLETDYLDIYYMHGPDPNTPIEETAQTLDSIVNSGKVRYIGFSNFAAWQITEMLWQCDKHNQIAPTITQNVYNLLTRGIEPELIPCLKEHKMGLVIYNPIAGGLLSGKHQKDHPVENTRFSDLGGYYKRYWNDDSFDAIDQLTAIAKRYEMSLLELSLRWCISKKAVDSVILGVSKMNHLIENVDLCEKGILQDEVLTACDDVWASLKGTRFAYHREALN